MRRLHRTFESALVGWILVTAGIMLVSPLFIWSLPLADAAKAAAGVMLIVNALRSEVL